MYAQGFNGVHAEYFPRIRCAMLMITLIITIGLLVIYIVRSLELHDYRIRIPSGTTRHLDKYLLKY